MKKWFNQTPSRFICGVTTLFALSLASNFALAAMYKWVDDQGQVQYGDRIPPEYAKNELKTLNDQGITVDTRERAPTLEERIERHRQTKIRAEIERVRQERVAYDRVLLDTFTTEQDMVKARDNRIDALDASIRITKGRITTITERLQKLTRKAADIERSGKQVPEKLHNEIQSNRAQVEHNEGFIRVKKSEQTQIREVFEADIRRFRELKSKEAEAKARAAAELGE